MKYYLDCEFDGHNGPLLSMALVPEDGASIYIRVMNEARDPWVVANVMPLIDSQQADILADLRNDAVGAQLRWFIENFHRDESSQIIADSPVDIARFCQAISTSDDGGYAPCMAAELTFEVHDVDCYPTTLPGAVQHNAWWDAMALRHKLSPATREGIAG